MTQMQRFTPLLVSVTLLAGTLGTAPPAHGEEAEAEAVRFDSADGVRLRGTYYAAGKPRSPCVLLLHALGKDSRHSAWKTLAGALQKKGYAVLAFDFRGHGESTQVDPDQFWSAAHPGNRALVRGAPGEEIHFKDFDRHYYPMLANDIAAARAFLDRKNDQGECNSSNLVLIGADTGATLGALWLNAESHRYRVLPAAVGVPARPAAQPEVRRACAPSGWRSARRSAAAASTSPRCSTPPAGSSACRSSSSTGKATR